MSWFDKLSQGVLQVADLFSKQNVDSGQNSELNKTSQVSFWTGIFGGKSTSTPGFSSSGLNNAAQKIQLTNDDIAVSLSRQATRQAVQANPLQQDDPKAAYKPYDLVIPIPAGQETLSYDQLQNTVIKSIFKQNGVQYSRASLEEIAKKEKLDYSPGYDYAAGKLTYNEKDGLWANQKPQTVMTNGTEQRVLRFSVSSELQQTVMGNKALSETIKASGKKTIAELSMNERMQVAMKIAYDKHLPHTVGEAIREVDPKQLMVGVAVAGGIVAAAKKGGADKLIPYVGAGVTLAQMTKYHAEAEYFLKLCSEAKTEADLDKAAQQFAMVVKQGGIDTILTVATAGAGKLGAVSRAGGQLVDDTMRIADDATRAALAQFKQWNDEIVAGMRKTYGDDLAFENVPTNVTTGTKNIDDLVNAPMEARAAKAENTGARRNVEMQEAAGGHTREQHIGKSESWLMKRLDSDLDIPSASSYRNEVTANRTVGKFIKQNRKDILEWLKSDSHRFEGTVEMESSIGIVLEREAIKSVETNKAWVTLVKDNSPHGWHVHTSFPIDPNKPFSYR